MPPASTASTTPDRPGGRSRWKIWAIAILVALLALILWMLPTWKAQAEVGAAYAARIGCSCRYVQDRSLASCQRDFEPGMEMVSVEEVEGARAIRGYVPALASRTAHFAGPSGCLLDPR
jgi:hypothetical protein